MSDPNLCGPNFRIDANRLQALLLPNTQHISLHSKLSSGSLRENNIENNIVKKQNCVIFLSFNTIDHYHKQTCFILFYFLVFMRFMQAQKYYNQEQEKKLSNETHSLTVNSP